MARLGSKQALLILFAATACSSAIRAAPPDPGSFTGDPATLPPTVPVGFVVQPAAPVPVPTSLAFAPDGSTLYVSTLGGAVLAYPVLGGAALGPPVPFLEGLESPLGVLATEHGVFVSVVADGAGAVLRARDTDGDFRADVTETVISGLPIGRHNTNGMAIGPDGMLYVTNGNATDSGFRDEGGPPEVPPYSGSLLRIDPGASNLAPQPTMVVGTGWRNIYDVAFVPAGHPFLKFGRALVPMNGTDGAEYEQPDGTTKLRPASEDTLSMLDVTDGVVEHFGFPWCLYDRANRGLKGFTQDPAEGECDPLPAAAAQGLVDPIERARPVALLGLHVSANGLAFNPGTSFPAAMNGDLFIAEFGNFSGDDVVGHKVVRVRFGPKGRVAGVETFMNGALPLDLAFAPDGALWIADFGGQVLRVSAVPGL